MARILVVDDDAQMVSVLRLTFQTGGHDVAYTQDPKQVISVIEADPVDGIVLDVLMPDVSGWELLDRLRSHPRAEPVPIVILSALTDAADRVRAIRSGADDSLVKPVDPDELLARVEALIPRKLERASGLQGSLESHTISEIVQNLEQNRKSGVLEVSSVFDSGWLEIIDGGLNRAGFQGYEGDEAVLALSGLSRGRFRFRAHRPELEASQGLQSFQALLVQAAWVDDELCHRRRYLPSPEIAFRLRPNPPRALEDWDTIPIEGVISVLANGSPTSLHALLDRKLAAPSKVRLALAWLFEQQAIESVSEPVSETAYSGAERE